MIRDGEIQDTDREKAFCFSLPMLDASRDHTNWRWPDLETVNERSTKISSLIINIMVSYSNLCSPS
jgi:hypothetical protein